MTTYTFDEMERALLEALVWAVDLQGDGPYQAPFAISGDLWRMAKVETKDEALTLIRDAVKSATRPACTCGAG